MTGAKAIESFERMYFESNLSIHITVETDG